MPLSAHSVSRTRSRSVRFEADARADGLRNSNAHLADVKPEDSARDTCGEAVGPLYLRWQCKRKTGTD